VDWCYNGKTVNNVRHYDYMKENGAGVADYQGLIQNSLTYPGSVHDQAFLVKQAKIALCVVKYGCYTTYYPLERFTWVTMAATGLNSRSNSHTCGGGLLRH
jgi:predicted MarR family transcription regulator